MNIYAFGSICRGDVSPTSDIDVLVIGDDDGMINKDIFTHYKPSGILNLWITGNPFAWHLYLESRLVYSSDGEDFISTLGSPQPYRQGTSDCEKFRALFHEAWNSLLNSRETEVYDLSVVFLSLRNFATCYSLSNSPKPNFSRRSALALGDRSIPVSATAFAALEQARMLSVRGRGSEPTASEVEEAMASLPLISQWMDGLLEEQTAL